MRKVAFNSIVLTLGAYFATGASAITYLLAARVLGPTLFGLLLGAIGIAVVVAAFADFGVNGWVIRALARNPSSTELFTTTLTAKLILAALLALAWVAFSLTFVQPPSLKLPIALLGGYLASQVIVGTLTVPFRASENMSVVSIVGAVEKAVTMSAWLALEPFGGSRSEILPIALVAGGSASVMCAIILAPRHLLGIARPSLRQSLDVWRSSYSFGMVGISSQILRADTAIVTAVAGGFAAGVYAAPARLTSFLTVIPSSFSAAVFPRIARSAIDGHSRRPELISAGLMLIVMTGLLGAIAVAAPILVPRVLGHDYLESVDVLRIYLLVVLINSANQPLLAVLQAEGHEDFAARAMVATSIVGLVAVAVGARLHGAAGAALGALLLQMFQLVLFASKARSSPGKFIASDIGTDITDGKVDAQWVATEVDDDA